MSPLKKGKLKHGMDKDEMNEMKSMMQNVRFSHDLRIFQKARRNLLKSASRITHTGKHSWKNMPRSQREQNLC